jgi:Zn-dependent protease
MKGSLKLGRIAGIGLFVHWTFLLLIGYIIFSNYRAGHDAGQTTWSVVFVLSIFVTVLLHELGHALAAKRYHIDTKDITLLPIGGLARLEKMPEKPSEELVVAIAGPAVNIALAIITGLFIQLPAMNELSVQLSGGINASNFFLNFFIVNIWLAVFNLIPAFPMDGGRVLRALLSMRLKRHVATQVAARIGQAIAVGFVLIGFFVNPFLVLIGLFIFIGAQAEASYTQAQSMLKDYRVRHALMREYRKVESGETLGTAVKMLLNGQNKSFVVTQDGLVTGILSRDEIIRGLSEKGEDQLIGNIMNRQIIRLDADMPLEEAYLKSREHSTDLMVVVQNDQIIGTIDTENILEFIMVQTARKKNSG